MQYFIYSRNRDNDYKLIYAPNEEHCPSSVRQYFIKQARGVINIEQYPGTLDTPRWLISQKDGIILFGMGIMNHRLSETNNTDYTGTPVRGFFGLIINPKYEEKYVPYDITFFKKLYQTCIDPIWQNPREEFKFIGTNAIIDKSEFNCIEAKQLNSKINVYENKITVFPENIDPSLIIADILSQEINTSYVSNLDAIEHATADEYCFYNASVNGIEEQSTKSKGHHSAKEDKTVEIPITPEKPKKVFGPKEILRRSVQLLLSLGKSLLKKILKKNSNNSTLGEKQ